MTTGTTSDFTLNRNQIIIKAFKLLGVLGTDESIDNADLSEGIDMLNMMIKLWEADGINLWKKGEGVLYFTEGTAQYKLGNGAHAADADDVVETTVATAATSGASTITLTSVTGMAVSDIIGIVIDASNTIQWTTISAINTGTKVVTLGATLTADIPVAANVYTYTTALSRPFDLTQVRYRTPGPLDREINNEAREYYYSQPSKTIVGKASFFYYEVGLTSSSIFLWPCPDSVNDQLRFTYIKPLYDFDNSSDNPDFPSEWLLAIVYNLAVLLAPLYNKIDKLAVLGPEAQSYYKIAQGHNKDSGSIYLVPENRG